MQETNHPKPNPAAQPAKLFNITRYLIIGDIASLLLVTLVGMLTPLPNLIGGYFMCLNGQLQTAAANFSVTSGFNLPYFSFTCVNGTTPREVTLAAMIISFGFWCLFFGFLSIVTAIVKQK